MSTWEQLHSEEAAELAHVVQLIEPVSVLEVPIHLLPEVVVEARNLRTGHARLLKRATPTSPLPLTVISIGA